MPKNLPKHTYNQQLGGVSGVHPYLCLFEVLLSGNHSFFLEPFDGLLVDGSGISRVPLF